MDEAQYFEARRTITLTSPIDLRRLEELGTCMAPGTPIEEALSRAVAVAYFMSAVGSTPAPGGVFVHQNNGEVIKVPLGTLEGKGDRYATPFPNIAY
jgi:hypothetical protein